MIVSMVPDRRFGARCSFFLACLFCFVFAVGCGAVRGVKGWESFLTDAWFGGEIGLWGLFAWVSAGG